MPPLTVREVVLGPQTLDRTRIVREGTVRAADGGDAADDGELPTRLEITIATSDPVRLFSGSIFAFDERLSMSRGAVDLSRLRNSAPFLLDHVNSVENIVGTIQRPRIDGDRLVAEVELIDSDRAKAYAALVKQGAALKVSVGFRVERWKRTRDRDDETGVVAEYTAVRWTPHEASAVAVPADDRAAVDSHRITHLGAEMPPEDTIAAATNNAGAAATNNAGAAATNNAGAAATNNAGAAATNNAGAAAQIRGRNAEMAGQTVAGVMPAVLEERERVRQLRAYGAEFERVDGPRLAQEVEESGGSLSDLRHEIAKASEKQWREQGKRNVAAGHVSGATGDGDPGLAPADIAGFSFVRAAHDVLLARDNPRHNSHELDVMRTTADRLREHNARPNAGAFSIPSSVLGRQRVLEAGSGDGANLVATDLRGFIEYLRADSVLLPRSTMLPDLVGNYDIPRQSGTVSVGWRQESDAESATSDPDFDQLELRPKEMILGTTVTRRFLHQPQVGGEMIVRQDLGAAGALGIDFGGLLGTGADGMPTGVFRAIEAGTVPDSGDGNAAANKMSWAAVVDLETQLGEGDALKGNLAYVTNPFVRSLGKLALRGGSAGEIHVVENNMTNGFPIVATTQIPKTFNSKTESTGGDKSLLLFGNWRDVIIAQWAGADFVVNPFSGQMRNRVTISLHLMIDVAVRHVASFAGSWDIGS